MSSRLATRLGLPAPEDRLPGAMDLARFHEPATGSLARTKGSLFLLAQLTGGDAHLARAAADALEQLQHDYYYDLSAGSSNTTRSKASAGRSSADGRPILVATRLLMAGRDVRYGSCAGL